MYFFPFISFTLRIFLSLFFIYSIKHNNKAKNYYILRRKLSTSGNESYGPGPLSKESRVQEDGDKIGQCL